MKTLTVGSEGKDMGRGLRGVPLVPDVDGLLDLGFGRAKKAASRVDEPNRTRRTRAQLKRLVQASSDVLSSNLKNWVRAWPSLDQMTPFARALTTAAVGEDAYRKHLGALDWAARSISSIAKDSLTQMRHSTDIEEVHEIRRGAYGRMSSVVHRIGPDLDWLREAHGTLRDLPSIDDDAGCVVVAGAPNVGKSALIACLSKASPEVAAYPFTTKRLHIGHFIHRRIPVQIIDTPGLLDRADSDRNMIELQALAALDHAGDLVLFLLDPTETCGVDLETQRTILSQVREHLGSTPVWVVEAKADLWMEVGESWERLAEEEQALVEQREQVDEPDAWVPAEVPEPLPGKHGGDIALSALNKVGVDSLQLAIGAHLVELSRGDALSLPEGWHRSDIGSDAR